ncbi:hypothetical protein F4604DRAFT_1916126 [Suillus subluteus]|nr:hypothetical protein F4604DRAFT_1916126 [Suillus subluteus]
MSTPATGQKKKSRRTREQRKISAARTAEMWKEVGDARSAYMVTIADLAEKYHTYVWAVSLEWMSKQFFLGGKLLKSSRKVSVFNAVVRREIAKRKENGILDGRKTLAIVSRELKESGEWKNLTQDEEDDLMEDIQVENMSKAPIKIYAKDVATEIAKTMGNIDPEIIGLEKRTGCNVFWGLTRNTSNDNFGPRSYASDPVKNACLALFKLTPEQIVVNIDAYIASGVEGVIRTSEEILNKRGVSATEMPQVAYHNHKRFVCVWGIELVGWTEGAITNPGEITSSVALRRLHNALKDGLCYWRELTNEELTARKEVHEQCVISGEEKTRATRSDKGKRKRGRPAPSISAKSKAIVPDSDSEHEDPPNHASNVDSPLTATSPSPAINDGASPLSVGITDVSNNDDDAPQRSPAFIEASRTRTDLVGGTKGVVQPDNQIPSFHSIRDMVGTHQVDPFEIFQHCNMSAWGSGTKDADQQAEEYHQVEQETDMFMRSIGLIS